jgi:hypothetical protein
MTNSITPTMENNSSSSSITIHLSLTSSPSSPRIDLVLDSGGGSSSISAVELQTKVSKVTNIPLTGKTFFSFSVVIRCCCLYSCCTAFKKSTHNS